MALRCGSRMPLDRRKIKGTMKDGRLRGRFIWLLEEMCRNCGVDVQLIDPTLDYYENKRNIEMQTRKRLFLKPEKAAEAEIREMEALAKTYMEMMQAYEEGGRV